MSDQYHRIVIIIAIVLQIGAVVAAVVIAERPLTRANFSLLILACVVIGLGRFLLRRAERQEARSLRGKVDVQESESTK